MLPIFPGIGSTAQEPRSAVSYIEARVKPLGQGPGIEGSSAVTPGP